MTLSALIDKQDNVEIIRDQIAAILAIEVKGQMALARTANRNPDDWKLRVFSERSNRFEQFLNQQNDSSPLVNVWWDSSSFDRRASDNISRQKSDSIYNIDCYGFAKSADEPSGGHIPGDREAAFECLKAVRLVRNILMAANYTFLNLRTIVWSRWVEGVNSFQVQQDANQIQQVIGARLAFRVEFNEFSPEIPLETLDLLSVSINRAEDGQLIVSADYDYTI